jgi:hypothetical protein
VNDIESRLRATLHDLADTVPPSGNPRADLEQRLASRSRRPVLVVAAVAAVVAAVAVPVILGRHGDLVGGPTDTTSPSPTADFVPRSTVIGEFDKDGVHGQLVLTIEKWDNGHEMVCEKGIAPGHPDAGTGGCSQVPARWPEGTYAGAPPGVKGWVSGDASISSVLPNQWVIMAAPRVASLSVRREDGSWVPAELVAESPRVKAFLAEIEGGYERSYGYVAKDAGGEVLEQVVY